ncbi:MAG: ribosomal protein S18-alanine N-acetyltransferase [Thermodesulfobacteria bacterium]|nr:ribosomal protein S18-alanine N-acetyltransferase [Thermodesulfobacteriota bacterium]
MPKPRLRPARLRDLKDILFIERISFPTPWTPLQFGSEFFKKGSRIWVIEEAGKIRGYVCFWEIADEIHLANIAVSPERRRKGLASFMLRTLVRYAKRRGFRRILLEVRERNLPAQRLYEKFGFRTDGRRRSYYPDTGEDAILMSLSLD